MRCDRRSLKREDSKQLNKRSLSFVFETTDVLRMYVDYELFANNYPFVFILGGEDIKRFLYLLRTRKDADIILIGGLIGKLGLIAKGHDIGSDKSLLEKKGVLEFLTEIKYVLKDNKNIILPLDLCYEENGQRCNVTVFEFPAKKITGDIGERTIAQYKNVVLNAKVTVFSDVLGDVNKNIFQKGTFDVLNAFNQNRNFKFICGEKISKMAEYKKIKYDFSGSDLPVALLNNPKR